MWVKLPLGDLNPSPYLPHPTSIYTCGVTTAPRVRGGQPKDFKRGKNVHREIESQN